MKSIRRRHRLRVERQGRYVRLLTKNGHNWTSRFPWIVEAALKNREQSSAPGFQYAVERGWLELHENATYVRLLSTEAPPL
jgi:hypothetical protein